MSARPDLTTEDLIALVDRQASLEESDGIPNYVWRAIAQRLRSERPAPCTFKAFGKFPCELPEGHDGDHIWRALREMRESLMHDYPSERPAVTPEMVEAALNSLDQLYHRARYWACDDEEGKHNLLTDECEEDLARVRVALQVRGAPASEPLTEEEVEALSQFVDYGATRGNYPPQGAVPGNPGPLTPFIQAAVRARGKLRAVSRPGETP